MINAASLPVCPLLMSPVFLYSHGSAWPTLFSFPHFNCESRIRQSINGKLVSWSKLKDYERGEWENRLIRNHKLFEDVREIEGWKGFRPQRLEHVRDECHSSQESRNFSVLTLWVQATPTASRPLSLILLTPKHPLHSSVLAVVTVEVPLHIQPFVFYVVKKCLWCW